MDASVGAEIASRFLQAKSGTFTRLRTNASMAVTASPSAD
jgi:hypothetical protein